MSGCVCMFICVSVWRFGCVCVCVCVCVSDVCLFLWWWEGGWVVWGSNGQPVIWFCDCGYTHRQQVQQARGITKTNAISVNMSLINS